MYISAVSKERWHGTQKGVAQQCCIRCAQSGKHQGMEACKLQYETLRRHALEADEISSSTALEMAFIEYRGLVAWLTDKPPCLSPGALPADLQTAESENPDCDLILALADLVLGNRLEEKDDSRD